MFPHNAWINAGRASSMRIQHRQGSGKLLSTLRLFNNRAHLVETYNDAAGFESCEPRSAHNLSISGAFSTSARRLGAPSRYRTVNRYHNR